MTIEYIRYRVDAARAAAFEEAYARAAVPLARAEQCLDFELSRCAEEAGQYVLRIRWTSAEDHLKGFRTGEHFAAFFAEIAPYVRDIQEMRHYEPTAVAGKGGAHPTLYAWAGGAEALERLFTRFYEHVDADPLLAPLFAGKDPEHARHVATWLGEVFGGPRAYSTAHGGHRGMAGHHLGLGIDEPRRRRWVALLLDTADEVGLPADPEFRAVLAYYLEWGTRMAVLYAGPNPPPLPDSPMPRWDWALTPPYRG